MATFMRGYEQQAYAALRIVAGFLFFWHGLQKVMPSYASQIPRDDRWAIVHYVRVLQRAHNAKESDLK